ncbi:MAG: tetratricopeptide repeat protein [Gemmatimonadetes bacterium]|nr:tetratricopeptide repeat protein [Gemmatimonadota bacterium]
MRQVAGGLKGAERESFLVEVARRADGAHLARLAYWAYSQLLSAGGPSERLLAIRSRLAELALQAGDTATARENYRVLEAAAAASSPERREALALRIELEARSGDPAAAARSLGSFRQEFPDAGELDRLAAAAANAYLARGDGGAAEKVIDGVTGPRTGLVRGRIALQKGDVERARSVLLAAAPGLQGTEGTDAVALVSLLTRLSPAAGKLVGRAVAKVTEGQTSDAVALLSSESRTLPPAERAAILDFAAGMAARAGMDAEAEALRRTLITDFPNALETPAAMLALARALADRPQTLAEARELLERLIIDYPKSALVPEARRELDLLQGRIPRS